MHAELTKPKGSEQMTSRDRITSTWSNPEYVETIGDNDLFRAELDSSSKTVLLVLPALRDDWPGELKAAVELRRRAMLTGRCDCGGRRPVAVLDRGEVQLTTFRHEDDGAATDASLRALFERLG
jgi:hypothetical protein